MKRLKVRSATTKLLLVAIGWLSLAALNLSGQPSAVSSAMQSPKQAAAAPSYDVASIRKYKPDGGPMMVGVKIEPDGLIASHMTLKGLICLAYGMNDYQVSGGPAWVSSDMYDVEAKMDESSMEALSKLASKEATQERRRMLQALLADRFKLSVLRQTKELPAFTLVLAKGGARLHPVAAATPPPEANRELDANRPQNMMQMQIVQGGILITAQATSIDRFASQLSADLRAPVENKTGLDGNYDFTLRYSPQNGGDDPSSTDSAGPSPSIFAAVQEQLGLKLESRKGPVEVIVIDRVERPSAN